jgi:hypothetical protein
MTHQEREALAVLRTGGSFEDASQLSGLSVSECIALWERSQ